MQKFLGTDLVPINHSNKASHFATAQSSYIINFSISYTFLYFNVKTLVAH